MPTTVVIFYTAQNNILYWYSVGMGTDDTCLLYRSSSKLKVYRLNINLYLNCRKVLREDREPLSTEYQEYKVSNVQFKKRGMGGSK